MEFQLNAICAEISDNGIEETLKRVPEDMDATYDRILSTINKKPRAQRELARRILMWVTYTRKPLPIDALAYAISIEINTNGLGDLKSSIPTHESIIDACANLISVDRGENPYVRFVHFSVQEFLKSHRLATLSIGYEMAHREIVRACILFLTLCPSRREFLFGRCTPGWWLHLYASNEWPHHLLAGNLRTLPVEDQIVALSLSFFERGPVLLTEQPTNLWNDRREKIFFTFSPPVLALMFDVPNIEKRQPLRGKKSGKEQPEAVYDYNLRATVLCTDKIAIHYAVAELDSVPMVQRLYNYGYSLNYSYSGAATENLDCLRLPSLYSVQSTKMARYLLDSGISIEPNPLGRTLVDPLKYFAQKGNRGIEVFRLLVDRVLDQDDGRLIDVLRTAIEVDCLEAVRVLLENGAYINFPATKDGTVLQHAVHYGKLEAIQLLLEKGADINAQGGKYGNPLQTAAYYGNNIGIMQLLLDKGASVNTQGGMFGNALQAAAYEGNINSIRLLLDKGADVNARGGKYGNALQAQVATWYSTTEAIQLLLDRGANVSAQGGKYGNALQAAACMGKVDIIWLLLDKGADVNAMGGWYGNALQTAAYEGQVHVVRLLLDKGADVNAKGGWYGNALQAAAYEGKVDVVRLLLGKRADVNAYGGICGNALQAAALNGNFEVVQLLLDRGADVNTQGGKYGNPLQAALCGNEKGVVRLLLDKGADVNAQCGIYGNALQAAVLYLYEVDFIWFLLYKGADVNAQGGIFGNALQAAVYQGGERAIRLLLDHGADVNTLGGFFGTALQAAAYNGNIKIIMLLLDEGADINARAGKYGAALEKMLALEPVGTGLRVPGDIALLDELLQDYAPGFSKNVPEPGKRGAFERGFSNKHRCSLDVFREILESRGEERTMVV